MKIAIIAVVGALGLTACTTTAHRNAVEGEFPPFYSSKSEYKSTSTGNASKDKVYLEKRSNHEYYRVKPIPETLKKALVSELEDLREKDLAFVVVIGANGSSRLLKAGKLEKSNHLTSKRIKIKTITPITIMTYRGSPHCVAIVHDVDIGGDHYEEYCAEWAP